MDYFQEVDEFFKRMENTNDEEIDMVEETEELNDEVSDEKDECLDEINKILIGRFDDIRYASIRMRNSLPDDKEINELNHKLDVAKKKYNQLFFNLSFDKFNDSESVSMEQLVNTRDEMNEACEGFEKEYNEIAKRFNYVDKSKREAKKEDNLEM